MFEVDERIQIADSEFSLTYARSSGAGGQNVNKVNSKAVLRWHPQSSAGVPNDVLRRFMIKFEHRLTTDAN